jgi:hypothetical protein
MTAVVCDHSTENGDRLNMSTPCLKMSTLKRGWTDIGHQYFLRAVLLHALTKDSQVILEFGKGSLMVPDLITLWNPFGGSHTTLDTQHIVRAYTA